MNKKDFKIVFFGTPEFAVASLSKLLDEGYNISAVVTMPDKIAGRGHKLIQSDVKRFAESRGLSVLQPEKLKDPGFISELRAINADLFIVIAFRMLPEIVWSMPPCGTFNLHASLLPKYRGAAPINRAIMNGESVTGVTTFFLRHEIDTGDIIEQRSIEIAPDENVGSVHDRLMELGAEMVCGTVSRIVNGEVVSRPQPEGDFVPAPKIFKEDCLIDWNKDVVEIHNQVRGLSPYPAAWCEIIDNKDNVSAIKIFVTSLPEKGRCPVALSPGECMAEGRRLFVGTASEAIEIHELQPAGKKRMTTADFLLGYHPVRFGGEQIKEVNKE